MAVRSLAAVGVDILAEQRELARACLDEAARLGDDRCCWTRRLGAPGVRHDAERAELVTALLDREESRDARQGRQLLGQTVELAFQRKVGVEHARLRARPPVQQLGESMVSLRTDHDVDEGGPLEHGLAFGLGYTTCDADQHVHAAFAPPLAQTPQPAELGIHLLGSLFPDVARVQDDEIGVIGGIGGGIAMRHQRIRHPGGIIHVHLAAVGLDEQLLGHASAATSREIACRYAQTGTRRATCHADRLALPHGIFMGIRRGGVKRPGWQIGRSPAVRTGHNAP